MALGRGSWKVGDADQPCLPLAVRDGEGARHGEFLVNEKKGMRGRIERGKSASRHDGSAVDRAASP